jgi:T5SS/PEP-CTERM-associated repeat protein
MATIAHTYQWQGGGGDFDDPNHWIAVTENGIFDPAQQPPALTDIISLQSNKSNNPAVTVSHGLNVQNRLTLLGSHSLTIHGDLSITGFDFGFGAGFSPAGVFDTGPSLLDVSGGLTIDGSEKGTTVPFLSVGDSDPNGGASLFAGPLTIGDGQFGVMQTAGKADIRVADVVLAKVIGSEGTILLQHAGATLQSGNVTVGSGGKGTIKVSGGATFTDTGFMTLADETGSTGLVTVGASSTLIIAADLASGHIASDGGPTQSKQVDVDVAGGVLRVNGSVTLGGLNAAFQVENGGFADIDGNLTFGGRHDFVVASTDLLSVLGGSLDVKGNITLGFEVLDNINAFVGNTPTNTGTLFWGGTFSLIANAGGTTKLTIQGGGTVAPDSDASLSAFVVDGFGATALVTGNQSELNTHNATLVAGANLSVVNGARATIGGLLELIGGSVTISSGGGLEARGGGSGQFFQDPGVADDTFQIDFGKSIKASGPSTISALQIKNDGQVEVADKGGGSAVTIDGPVIGSGLFKIDAPNFTNTTQQLEFTKTVDQGIKVEFDGAKSTLKLDDPAHFKGLITGFNLGDTIALGGVFAADAQFGPTSSTIIGADGKQIFDAEFLLVTTVDGAEIGLRLTGVYTNPVLTITHSGGTSFITLGAGLVASADPHWKASNDIGTHPGN